MNTVRKDRTEFAFTLLELAVVIVVLAVIGYMMLPQMTGNKAKPTRIQCVNQLKQIGSAALTFAADNDGQFPAAVSNSLAFGEETRAWVHFQALSNRLATPKLLSCPEDVKKQQRQRAENFAWRDGLNDQSLSKLGNGGVSYFIALNATGETPQAILSGDRSVAPPVNRPAYSTKAVGVSVTISTKCEWSTNAGNNLHDRQGDFLLGDGSVNQSSVSILQNQLQLSMSEYGTNVNRFVFPQ